MSGDLLVLVGLAVIIFQAWVTYLVITADEYSALQKALQVALIWLLPVIPAIHITVVLWAVRKRPRPRDTAFIPESESRG
jgi:cytochrome bd-type quinol oxidase subunit 2